MNSPAEDFSMYAQDEFDFRPGISMIMSGAVAGAPDTKGMSVNDERSMAGTANLASPNPGGTPDNDFAYGTTMAMGEEDDATADQAPGSDKNGLIGVLDPDADFGGSRFMPWPDAGPDFPDEPFMGAWNHDMLFDLG